MTLPVIINIDSKYDWTKEVKTIWDNLVSTDIQPKFPFINEKDFEFRMNNLVIIGLCSPAFIERGYNENRNVQNRNTNDESEIKREEQYWREAQLQQNSNNEHFNGEEPNFRSPIINPHYVTECYGIYTDDCSAFLSGKVDIDKLPLGANGGAGIFLCPERIIEIYPTLIARINKIRNPIPLSSNPILINLKIVLLHELGHHLFPVHCNSARRKYIPEAIANFFCHSNLQESEKAWLLYKSRCLQPPEYSTYRFIELLKRYYKKEIDTVLKFAFNGDITGWDNIFDREIINDEGYKRDWKDLIERQSELTTMFISLETIPTNGFLEDLQRIGGYNRTWAYCFDGILFQRQKRLNTQIPPDFVWDLYNDNSILSWVLSTEIPEEIWSSWGMSTSHEKIGTDTQVPGKLAWPEGPLFRTTDSKDWKLIIINSPYEWARNSAMAWLLDDLGDKSDISELLDSFQLVNSSHCKEVLTAFDRNWTMFNLTSKEKIINIVEQFTSELEPLNLSIRIEAIEILERFIEDKLKSTKA